MFTSTDYDKLEQLMAEKNENRVLIQKLLSSQEEAISTISHEIRNPLTLIYSTLQLLESRHPEIISDRYWRSMREDIEYMKQLLEELSSLNHSASLSCSTFSFREFMELIVLSFASSCTDNSIEFTSFLSPTLPSINADRTKLKEVFLNILRNAAEAVEYSGTIRLDALVKDHHIAVQIADSGCGISSEQQEKIFQPFVTYKSGGTGLGLAIAHRVIEAHGGQISVKSMIGKGTIFTILLPI